MTSNPFNLKSDQSKSVSAGENNRETQISSDLLASQLESQHLMPDATPPSTRLDMMINNPIPMGNDLFAHNLGDNRIRSQEEINFLVSDRERNAPFRFPIETRPNVATSSAIMSNPGQLPQSEQETLNVPLDRVRVIWGTNIVISDAIESFRSFLKEFTLAHRKLAEAREKQQLDITTTSSDTEAYYPKLLNQIRDTEVYNLNLDCENLRSFPKTRLFATQLLLYPIEMIQLMDVVINEIFHELYPTVDLNHDPIQVRPFNTGRTINMRNLDPSDLDKLISIKGLIIRVSNIIPDMRVGYFTCSVCNQSVSVESVRGNISEPRKCSNNNCNAVSSMTLIHNRSLFSDKQIIKIQETPDSIPDGQTPHTVTLCVYDALVDVARPGDRVEVTGIFRSAPVRVNAAQRKVKSIFRTYIDVVHLKRFDEKKLSQGKGSLSSDELLISFDETDCIASEKTIHYELLKSLSSSPDIYEKLANSIAPSVWGMLDIKKGLLLQLFGGISKSLSGNSTSRFRGDINILLAGDPGVSKSQLLQYVHKLSSRGIYTSGKGSSSVGLTAYITRDTESNQLVLESGALVLSDGGICCIDEFDKMSDETRTILHEVMEQQTVSIAKAGIITSLNARTSILASANPVESKYNSKKTIVENLNLPPTILSRFDIIYILLDNVNTEEDLRLGRHIVGLYTLGAKSSDNGFLDIHTLIKYIDYAKTLNPTISEAAAKEIANGYVAMRKVNGASTKTISATTRQLESLIRISEAHARMRLSNFVEEADVAEAIRLIRSAMMSYAIDPLTGKIDIDLINTGRSAAFRERQAEIKKLIRKCLSDSTQSSINFESLFSQLSSNSSIPLNEKWVKTAVEELMEEEFLRTSGDLRRENFTIHKLSS